MVIQDLDDGQSIGIWLANCVSIQIEQTRITRSQIGVHAVRDCRAITVADCIVNFDLAAPGSRFPTGMVGIWLMQCAGRQRVVRNTVGNHRVGIGINENLFSRKASRSDARACEIVRNTVELPLFREIEDRDHDFAIDVAAAESNVADNRISYSGIYQGRYLARGTRHQSKEQPHSIHGQER